jgi:hypothetical protein
VTHRGIHGIIADIGFQEQFPDKTFRSRYKSTSAH